jgi:hypothetical protein
MSGLDPEASRSSQSRQQLRPRGREHVAGFNRLRRGGRVSHLGVVQLDDATDTGGPAPP